MRSFTEICMSSDDHNDYIMPIVGLASDTIKEHESLIASTTQANIGITTGITYQGTLSTF